MTPLRQYWFRFEKFPKPTPLNLGCGVTAHDRDEAINLMKERVFSGSKVPVILEIKEDVAPSDLERRHVHPNMGDATKLGVWFPQGYERG